GQKADPDSDRITLDGKPVQVNHRRTYVMLHKPRGVLSDEGDGSGRLSTVRDLVSLPGRLFPVGRLDLRSEGLMLLTDDGDLTYRLTHPRFGHEKEYRVLVEGEPDEAMLERWRRGVFLDGKRTALARVTIARLEKGAAWLRVILREGRKRQIRRVAAMLGHPAQRVIRVRIGPLRLGDLKPGQWRRLTGAEVKALLSAARKPKTRGKRGRRRG
ncbi:MAG: rRNA pseudouridine synthase, partial [Anaerolineae bacterium]|nr:rRNA pseudouridine synthase [Anaerolineae bacterium]